MKNLRLIVVMALLGLAPGCIPTALAHVAETEVDPAAATAQGGRVFVHEAGGIQFELPANWTAEPEGDQITISTPDDSLAIVFLVLDAETIEAAMDVLGDEIDNIIENAEVTSEPSEGSINGLDSVGLSGIGEMDGRKVAWTVDVVMADRPVIVLAIFDTETAARHAASIQRFIKSIRAA